MPARFPLEHYREHYLPESWPDWDDYYGYPDHREHTADPTAERTEEELDPYHQYNSWSDYGWSQYDY